MSKDNTTTYAIIAVAIAALGYFVYKGAESVEKSLDIVKGGVTDLKGLVPSFNLPSVNLTMPNITMPNITMPNIQFPGYESSVNDMAKWRADTEAWINGLFGGSNSGGAVSTPTNDNRLSLPNIPDRIESFKDPATTLTAVLPSTSKDTVIYNPEMGRITLEEMQPLDRLTITNSQQVGTASAVLPSSTKVFVMDKKDYGTEDNYISYLGTVSPLFASMYKRTPDPND